MKCEEALLLISGHLDRENTAEEETALQAHLNGCKECRERLMAFEKTDRKLASLSACAPEGLCADIMAQIKKEAAKKKRRPWYSIAVAAALALVIGAGAATGAYETAEPQMVSVTDMQPMSRERALTDADMLAQELAQERNAPVAVVNELYYEIEVHPCESLEQGYLLYILPDYDAVIFLRDNYGCVVYEPAEGTGEAVSYALLVP